MIALLRWRLGRAAGRLDPVTGVALALLGAVLLAAIAGPLVADRPGYDVDIASAGLGPSLAHPLGTDHLGRDTLGRLILACRAFVGPGAVACLSALVLAVPAGAAAGWYGGVVARAIRYVATVVASVPRFVLVLLVITIQGDGLGILGLAAGCAYAPALAEEIYARIEALRADDYLVASRAHGVPGWRLLWGHLVLAACGATIGRHLLLLFGYVVVLETTLSYLGGFGVQEPMPSWGNMLLFEWGRAGSWVSRAAPALALWATLAAVTVVAGFVGGQPRE